MDRNPDLPGLLVNGTLHRFLDPPGRIGGELVFLRVIVLFHRAHKAEISFLNQVHERDASVGVVFCNRNHKPQVCLFQPVPGRLVSFGGLSPQLPLLIFFKKRNLTDLLQINGKRF